MINKLINYSFGQILIEVRGGYRERFLNACAQNGVDFWGVRITDEKRLCAYMRPRDFKKLRSLARINGCRVHILKKDGAPFFLHRNSKRYALWGGLAVFAGLMIFASMLLWTVDLTDAEGIDREKLIRALSECGVRPGVMRSSIDVVKAKYALQLKIPELEFISINLSGAEASIVARARYLPPEMENMPGGEIVASKPGLITKFTLFNGFAQTAIGHTVLQGEVLVSSRSLNPDGSDRFSPVDAQIRARTWTTLKIRIPSSRAIKHFTQKTKTRRAFIWGVNRINLYFSSGISLERYDKIIKENYFSIFGNLLPLGIVTETFKEYTITYIPISQEDASVIGSRIMDKYVISSMKNGEIKSNAYEVAAFDGYYIITASYECEENIAEFRRQ